MTGLNDGSKQLVTCSLWVLCFFYIGCVIYPTWNLWTIFFLIGSFFFFSVSQCQSISLLWYQCFKWNTCWRIPFSIGRSVIIFLASELGTQPKTNFNTFYENESSGEIELFPHQRMPFHQQNYDAYSNYDCSIHLIHHFLILNWILILLKHLLVFHVYFSLRFYFLVHWYFCVHQITIFKWIFITLCIIFLFIFFIRIILKCIFVTLSSYSIYLFSSFESFGGFWCFRNAGLSADLD